MLYIPGIIFMTYFYVSVKKSDLPDDSPMLVDTINTVIFNVLTTELLYFIGYLYDPFIYVSLSATNLILFFIAQDIYFYLVHKYVFHGPLWFMHHNHHLYITSYLAWYCNIVEHLLLNVGSVVFAFWLFPNTRWIFVLIICLQTYTSVNGHTTTSPHSVHHRFPNKRYGSIYLLDRMLNSF